GLLFEREQAGVLARSLEHLLRVGVVECELLLHPVEEFDLRLGELAIGDADLRGHRVGSETLVARWQSCGNRRQPRFATARDANRIRRDLGQAAELLTGEAFEEW